MPVCRKRGREEKSPKPRHFLFPHKTPITWKERRGKKGQTPAGSHYFYHPKATLRRRWMWELRSGKKVEWVTCMTVHRYSSPRRWRYNRCSPSLLQVYRKHSNRLAVVRGPEPWTRALMGILSPEKNATICRFNSRLVSWKYGVWCGWWMGGDRAFLRH